MSENFQAPDQVIDQLVDTDPEETAEWHSSFDSALKNAGPVRARYLMLSMLQHAQEQNVGISNLRTTDYINSIPPEREPEFPGNESIERSIRRVNRWNAAIMVHRAQRPGVGVGGHISSYASSASLYEVGFNHFFRGKDHPGGGDQIYFQGHASPGMYARAFMEGRFTPHQMDGF
ncbi:MAG: pyruvate dehydrogenase (acetyl-transferring), homodimeric type, partial [Actinobacteria bacterium]|nr:pyruvate dehydrogenase (acetyl-transferring), homodimeric type [Actinomycetota bacterium]